MENSGKLNRIERRKIEFRDKITDAALALFEEQGVSETSVASIIKEADIAHKTFFNHFPTKDHLLLHIAITFGDNAFNTFREGFKRNQAPGQRVEYCLINIAKTLSTVSPHYKELLNVYLISGAGSGDLQRVQKEQFTAVINKIMTDADEHGLLRSGSDAGTYTDMVVGICVATLLNWSLADDFPIVHKMKQAIVFLNSSIFITTTPSS
jgi:AcrR family transcriptional regulator